MVRRTLIAALLTALPATAADLNPLQLDPQAGEGCWVRFFDGENFERPLGRVAGHLYINSIANPGLIGRMDEKQFFQRASSLIVGPEATLIAYAEPGFRKEVMALEPRREVKDLRALGFPERVASLKIVCQPLPQQPKR
ncbi:MAG TPA: hypothetical protein VFZ81_03925 [Burkholderiales bacterium]